MIINHVSVGVRDLNTAMSFYDALFASLNIKRSHTIDNVAACYGEQFEFWIGCPCSDKATSGNGSHIAFNAPSKASVDEFYRIAMQHGATCNGKPGLRAEYAEGYYAAYIIDLDGNKLEAVTQL
ncbi:VOC family protein [Vibrio sp. TRT 21S02]|uniref:VOC family protein n=1 Tax=unclassified Vibrio TaxID=2614977 RepID=UPI00349F6306